MYSILLFLFYESKLIMPWAVAHFVKDNSVEVVPQTWVIRKPNGKKECLWPPLTNKTKLMEAVRNKDSPQCTWKTYEINILGCYDDFDIAQQKCNKARNTDNLSSETDSLGLKAQRRNRQRKHFDDYLYDYDVDLPSVPNRLQHKKHIDQVSDTDVSCSDDTNEEQHKNTEVLNINKKKTYQTPVKGDHKQNETQDNLEKTLLEFVKKCYEFQRQITREMFLIKHIVKENRESLDFLMKKMENENQQDNDTDMNKEVEEITQKFPLRFSEDLEEIEEKLVHLETTNAVAKHLSLIGGDGIKDVTLKLMYYILSNKLGSYYSWEGQKGKLVFKNLKLATLIIKAVRIREQNATDNEIIKRIKGWLVQAKYRETLKNKKAQGIP